MSFPKNETSLKSTFKELKEIVSRNQGENHESIAMVNELESLISDLERKAGRLSSSNGTDKRQSESIVSPMINGVVPVL